MKAKRTALVLTSALITLSFATAFAQIPAVPLVNAVEEDWQLAVSDPDPLGVGPQVTTVMSPVRDGSSPFFAYDMNYREYPNFAPGGMQIQVWTSGRVTGTSSQGSALFNTRGEVVTWTQRMAVGGGSVSYDINNGQSTTWGQFGQGAQLSVSFPSALADLSGYSRDASAANSGASWQTNHVTSLTLVRVRYYANGQLISTDSNPRALVAPPADSQ